jgi:hypothetical protein
VLAGLILCGLCRRRMDAHWVNDRAGYRCRHGHNSARRAVAERPRKLYVREGNVDCRVRPARSGRWRRGGCAGLPTVAGYGSHDALPRPCRGPGDRVRRRLHPCGSCRCHEGSLPGGGAACGRRVGAGGFDRSVIAVVWRCPVGRTDDDGSTSCPVLGADGRCAFGRGVYGDFLLGWVGSAPCAPFRAAPVSVCSVLGAGRVVVAVVDGVVGGGLPGCASRWGDVELVGVGRAEGCVGGVVVGEPVWVMGSSDFFARSAGTSGREERVVRCAAGLGATEVFGPGARVSGSARPGGASSCLSRSRCRFCSVVWPSSLRTCGMRLAAA